VTSDSPRTSCRGAKRHEHNQRRGARLRSAITGGKTATNNQRSWVAVATSHVRCFIQSSHCCVRSAARSVTASIVSTAQHCSARCVLASACAPRVERYAHTYKMAVTFDEVDPATLPRLLEGKALSQNGVGASLHALTSAVACLWCGPGTVVVDFTTGITGPYATMYLADQGATVVKVENTGSGGDAYRANPGFQTLNRGKFGVAAQLGRLEGPPDTGEITPDAPLLLALRTCGAQRWQRVPSWCGCDPLVGGCMQYERPMLW